MADPPHVVSRTESQSPTTPALALKNLPAKVYLRLYLCSVFLLEMMF